MAMVALTPTALATTFSVGADERPGGKEVGCSWRSQKEK
jgi:hypothetical protein